MADNKPKLAKQFAARLKERRKELGLTQAKVAEKIGADLRVYRKIENCETVPNVILAYKVLNALNLTLEEALRD
ncbi:helix-turn-helix transcriptional regulator [Roseivirga sp. BDSF3-8]|uniref:helix-turn-helix transcriptional regulator n=1 Tax=Roseivirga sp. BDSF3-8 TaxID=3241598 RepID=UPI0035326630